MADGGAAEVLRAPFPYPGGKRRIADVVWSALGDCRVYVEPFFGSGAVLLSRPSEPGIETVNDADGLLVHFWRALRSAPSEVARHADYPVSEIDLHARHRELVRRAGEVREQLEADPRWFDAELAGWWVWGLSQWIGGGWCSPVRSKDSARGAAEFRQRPHVSASSAGMGVHRKVPQRRPNLTTAGTGVQRQMPEVRGSGGCGVVGQSLDGGALAPWFEALADRLRRVRIVCGDFERVLTKSTLYVEGSSVAGGGHLSRSPEALAEALCDLVAARDALDETLRARRRRHRRARAQVGDRARRRPRVADRPRRPRRRARDARGLAQGRMDRPRWPRSSLGQSPLGTAVALASLPLARPLRSTLSLRGGQWLSAG